ncbi:hypothetical protein [Nonomuraea salmonea]|uniref:hypothetical protein n=1 Tax=Nonomuraea salmonea TaxID=46181 RepID=UPI002FE77AEE
MTRSLNCPPLVQHPERAVAGVHQVGRDLHDGAQRLVQLQLGADRQDRVEQPLHPAVQLLDLTQAGPQPLETLSTQRAQVRTVRAVVALLLAHLHPRDAAALPSCPVPLA